ncbi:AMP-binding enzyme family protein [Burkholderia pseudomallei TSV 25]|nr:AMP-binding enzyme family protein [Burkholderia pseudomallei TSV 25]
MRYCKRRRSASTYRVWEFFWPLMSGARLVIAKPEGHKDPAYLSELIDRERVTTLHFVPSMLQASSGG